MASRNFNGAKGTGNGGILCFGGGDGRTELVDAVGAGGDVGVVERFLRAGRVHYIGVELGMKDGAAGHQLVEHRPDETGEGAHPRAELAGLDGEVGGPEIALMIAAGTRTVDRGLE